MTAFLTKYLNASVTTVLLLGCLTAGSGHASIPEYSSGVLSFDDLGPNTLGAGMKDGYGGFDWGDKWFYMSLAANPGNTFLPMGSGSSTSISRSDHSDFYFDGADFWSRRGLDANGSFYFVLYNDGRTVFNGLLDSKNRMRFTGEHAFITSGFTGPIDAMAFAFSQGGDDWDHLAMDNFTFRAIPITTVPIPATSLFMISGLAVFSQFLRRRGR